MWCLPNERSGSCPPPGFLVLSEFRASTTSVGDGSRDPDRLQLREKTVPVCEHSLENRFSQKELGMPVKCRCPSAFRFRSALENQGISGPTFPEGIPQFLAQDLVRHPDWVPSKGQ